MSFKMRSPLNLVALCLLAGSIGWASPSFSQVKPAGTTAFAVVDVQKILRQSKATLSIRPQIQKLREEYKVEYNRESKQLREANQDLARQRTILSPEAFAQRRKAFEKRAKNIRRSVQGKKRTIDQAVAKAMSEVNRALRNVTVQIAKERSLDLILPKSTVFMVQTKHDVTNEVLKRLNKQLPSVTVSLSAPAKK